MNADPNRRIADIVEGVSEAAPERHARPSDYDVDWMNEHYAHVIVGGHPRIMIEDRKNSDPTKRQELITIEAFQSHLRTTRTWFDGIDGRRKPGTWANRWLIDPARRTYAGTVFHPDPNNEDGPDGLLQFMEGLRGRTATEGEWL